MWPPHLAEGIALSWYALLNVILGLPILIGSRVQDPRFHPPARVRGLWCLATDWVQGEAERGRIPPHRSGEFGQLFDTPRVHLRCMPPRTGDDTPLVVSGRLGTGTRRVGRPTASSSYGKWFIISSTADSQEYSPSAPQHLTTELVQLSLWSLLLSCEQVFRNIWQDRGDTNAASIAQLRPAECGRQPRRQLQKLIRPKLDSRSTPAQTRPPLGQLHMRGWIAVATSRAFTGHFCSTGTSVRAPSGTN